MTRTIAFAAVPVGTLLAIGALAACMRVAVSTSQPQIVTTPATATGEVTDAGAHRLGATDEPTATAWLYAAGTSGTVTVPADCYISGITACAGSDAGTSASMTIGATGTAADGATLDGSAGPSIPIPAGQCLSPPNLAGRRFSLGPGAVVTFTGTASYQVTYSSYGSF